MSDRVFSPMTMRHMNERNFRDRHPTLYPIRRYGIPAALGIATGGVSYLVGKYGLIPAIRAVYKHGFKRPANYTWRLAKNVGSAISNTPYLPVETSNATAMNNSSKPTPIPSPESKGYKSEQQKRF